MRALSTKDSTFCMFRDDVKLNQGYKPHPKLMAPQNSRYWWIRPRLFTSPALRIRLRTRDLDTYSGISLFLRADKNADEIGAKATRTTGK